MKPLAIDLFCGLGGWTEALLAEGYDVVGFDIERHVYGDHRYPAQLVLQDVTTLHGSQFRDAALIVASPPCQAYSYRAMPWKRARALPPPENTLFEACFRIQREACEAAGRHVPMIVENVRGAQKWVGRARWNFGSFYLWGDVPALMPVTSRLREPKVPLVNGQPNNAEKPGYVRRPFNGSPGHIIQSASIGSKVGGIYFNGYGTPGYKAQAFNTTAERRLREDIKNTGGSWFAVAHNTTSGKGRNPDGRKHAGDWFRDPTCPTRQGGQKGKKYDDGLKQPGIDLSAVGFNVANAREFGHMVEGAQYRRTADDKRQHIGKTRKFASAMIAKIPQPLARHIARTFQQPMRST
jgi:hypothetical protein